MMHKWALLFLAGLMGFGMQPNEWHFIRFAKEIVGVRIETDANASARTVYDEGTRSWVLRLEVLQEGEAAGVKFRPQEGAWNLVHYDSVYFEVRNLSEHPMVVYGKVANGDTENLLDNCRMATVLMPKERKVLRVRLVRRPEDPTFEPFKGQFMYYDAINVRDNTVDPSEIRLVEIWLDHPRKGQVLEIRSIYTAGTGQPVPVPFSRSLTSMVNTYTPTGQAKFTATVTFSRKSARNERTFQTGKVPRIGANLAVGRKDRNLRLQATSISKRSTANGGSLTRTVTCSGRMDSPVSGLVAT